MRDSLGQSWQNCISENRTLKQKNCEKVRLLFKQSFIKQSTMKQANFGTAEQGFLRHFDLFPILLQIILQITWQQKIIAPIKMAQFQNYNSKIIQILFRNHSFPDFQQTI